MWHSKAVVTTILLSCLSVSLLAQKKAHQVQAPKLAPYVTVGQYQIRPPVGSELEHQDGPDGERSYAWYGAPRADGTKSLMMLGIAYPPKGDTTSLERICQAMVNGIKRQETSFEQEESQAGTIGGLKFVRIGWSGVDHGFNMRGFHCVAKDGDKVILLWTQDVLPQGASSLEVADASILSFRKKR